MTIQSFDVVLYTAWFVMPGFIISEIIYSICPYRKMTDGSRVLKCIEYSLINLAVWFWAFILLDKKSEDNSILFFFLTTIALIVTSTITGFLLGIVKRSDLICKIFAFFNVQVEKAIPTAWDKLFLDRSDSCWAIVTISNGKTIAGKYSTKSFVSSDSEYRDMYLEETYTIDENGAWKKTAGTQGVWISPGEIRMIELRGGKNEKKSEDIK